MFHLNQHQLAFQPLIFPSLWIPICLTKYSLTSKLLQSYLIDLIDESDDRQFDEREEDEGNAHEEPQIDRLREWPDYLNSLYSLASSVDIDRPRDKDRWNTQMIFMCWMPSIIRKTKRVIFKEKHSISHLDEGNAGQILDDVSELEII